MAWHQNFSLKKYKTCIPQYWFIKSNRLYDQKKILKRTLEGVYSNPPKSTSYLPIMYIASTPPGETFFSCFLFSKFVMTYNKPLCVSFRLLPWLTEYFQGYILWFQVFLGLIPHTPGILYFAFWDPLLPVISNDPLWSDVINSNQRTVNVNDHFIYDGYEINHIFNSWTTFSFLYCKQ